MSERVGRADPERECPVIAHAPVHGDEEHAITGTAADLGDLADQEHGEGWPGTSSGFVHGPAGSAATATQTQAGCVSAANW